MVRSELVLLQGETKQKKIKGTNKKWLEIGEMENKDKEKGVFSFLLFFMTFGIFSMQYKMHLYCEKYTGRFEIL